MAKTVRQLLAGARQRLQAADIESAALDARLLLQDATGFTHEAIVADPDVGVSAVEAATYLSLVERRAKHEPVSRIRGRREFYGRAFAIGPGVLDPRPDTEALVNLVLRQVKPLRSFSLLDLGCGSGAIAITLLAECGGAFATAVDIAETARAFTQKNAVALGVAERLRVLDGPWLNRVDGAFDVIVSNPPYIIHDVIADLAVDVRDHDPHLALDGGVDGLACYRIIAEQAPAYLAVSGLLAVEIGAGQAQDVCDIFSGIGFVLKDQELDLAGRVRAMAFRRS